MFPVVLGANAGFGVAGVTDFDETVMVGFDAGRDITTGDNNTLIGFKAGNLITSGSNNIIIGHDVDPSSATADEELNIGDTILGDLSTGDVSIANDLTVADRLNLTLGRLRVPAGGSLDITSIIGSTSEAIRVGGIHIGGNYTDIPSEGDIITTTTNMQLKPGNVTALTLNNTTQDAAFTNNVSIAGTLNVTGNTTLADDLNLGNGFIRPPNQATGVSVITNAGFSAPVRMGGLHVGGAYSGSTPIDLSLIHI